MSVILHIFIPCTGLSPNAALNSCCDSMLVPSERPVVPVFITVITNKQCYLFVIILVDFASM